VAHHQLIARSATIDDASRIAETYNQGIHDRVATFETEPRTVDTIRDWFNAPYPIVVVEAEGEVVAWANASSYRPRACYAGNAEFSVYVDRSWRGQGAGRIAMIALIHAARAAGFEKLISRVFVENLASRGMLRKVGFREVGIYERHAKLDGVWRDVVIVELSLQDHTGEPQGALWQPDIDTLELWDAFRPAMEIQIEKQFPEPGRDPIRYDAVVMKTAAPEPWLETRGIWTFDTADVSGLIFERGGELREFFSPRHPFNVFAVYGADGTLNGWYGNVTWPARAYRDEDTLILAWPDLILDVVMLPDGTIANLDEDELQESNLNQTHPWLIPQIVAARDELAQLLRSGFFPYA
jgi:L-amino acid N-acyltransferase YncA